MRSTVQYVVNRLAETGLAAPGTLEGCSEAEIDEIEGRLSVRLPIVYRDFLLAMGHRAGRFLVGSDYSYPRLLHFRDAAQHLFARCGSSFSLPTTALVFLFHQGHSFLFFDTQYSPEEGTVLLFTDAEKLPRQVFNSFSEWLLFALEEDVAISKELEDEGPLQTSSPT